ncbi:OmpA family protein [Pyxidicoccus fallax]|uniref:OmpA family protein n=1 Tax=Pyxidicoccus fallax TaxID=394095 RepID=A0A848L5X8_9BACT|nr:OmpA family protein [Pyxidicoccus fallax]NMO14016.1 OmpA family protein [Pyxidicoccus fallax]NPC76652.1 OmpA family protein [Pyxidicoccus fallax]
MMRAFLRLALLATVLGALAPACSHTPENPPTLDDDGDGVRNADDACPRAKGSAATKGCPPRDTDGDGVDDSTDKCPRHAGSASREGCPARDLDEDGVEDSRDACPRVFGAVERQGCPVEDLDRDGLEGPADKCPEDAGPASRDGCPEKDADQDGVPDADDDCPLDEGFPSLRGCPERDTDGDSVADHRDNCPRQSGAQDNQGCPLEQKQFVIIRQDRLELRERIIFEPGTATLQARSLPVLDNVARVLLVHPEFKTLLIESHTDNRGDADANRALSQARAEVVREYLVTQGVPADRLDARGYGPDRPVASNETSQGREANRRVELLLPAPSGKSSGTRKPGR